MSTYLKHHGVLGMHWGVRRYQSYAEVPRGGHMDGKRVGAGKEVGEAALSRRQIRQIKKADRKGHSMGENYNKADANFKNVVKNDKEYRRLANKAADLEEKRLLMEKTTFNSKNKQDEEAYLKLINSKEYLDADRKSEAAYKAKQQRIEKLANDYVDTIKEAKLDDLGITKNREQAKKYISSKFNSHYYDDLLEYDIDNFYDPDGDVGTNEKDYKKRYR